MKYLKKYLPRQLKRVLRRLVYNLYESFSYRSCQISSKPTYIRHVIFVCKGNICRSSFAEYYLKSILAINVIKIDSCGLDVDQGFLSPPEAIKVGREFGVELGQHFSKGLSSCDFNSANLIVPMEYIQYLRLIELYPQYSYKIRLLRDFAPWPHRLFCNIYDPYGLGENEFRRCFLSMQRCLAAIKNCYFNHTLTKKNE